MNITISNKKLIVFGVAIVLAFFLITNVFKCNKPESTNVELYNKVQAMQDSIIAITKRERDHFMKDANEKEEIIDQYREQAKDLIEQNRQKEINYGKLADKLKIIPDRINRISNNKDSIRLAYEEF